jgi:hypothetical protein
MAEQNTYPADRVRLDIALAIKEIDMEVDTLLNRLALEYDKIIATGLTIDQANQQILDMVNNETGFYGSWRNSQKKIIRTMEKELVAKPMVLFANLNPRDKFNWILSGSVKEHCVDCSSLSRMEPRTISEWRKLGFGLPREALTECTYGCQCMLEKV